MRKRLNDLKSNRRQIVMVGAAATASAAALTSLSGSNRSATAATTTGTYGSGSLPAWANNARAITTATVIRRVVATNGVVMFGDNIAVQDGKALAIRLLARDGSQLAVHNWSGRPTSGAVDALLQWSSSYGLPKRILMATGTNDIFDPPKFAAQIDRTMTIVGRNRTVYWVNVQVARSTVGASLRLSDQRNSSWVNLQLSDAQKQFPNLRIIHWSEYLWAKPNRLGTYLRDGMNTSVPLGQDARNELMVQALVAP